MSLRYSTEYSVPMDLPEKDPAKQWEWHEAYRDMAKNMYRTSYTDASHFREVNVKSDYPVGYGGHIACVRHDVLHRNAEFDRKRAMMRQDPSRDAHPSFNDQLSGVPWFTMKPCGAPKNPTYKVSYNDGTTTPMAPWGVTSKPVRDKLNHRFVPPTLKRAYSSAGFTSGMGRSTRGLDRQNSAAMSAGALVAPASPNITRPPVQTQAYEQQYEQAHRSLEEPSAEFLAEASRATDISGYSPTSDRLRRTVTSANAEAGRGYMPTEAEVLMEQMK